MVQQSHDGDGRERSQARLREGLQQFEQVVTTAEQVGLVRLADLLTIAIAELRSAIKRDTKDTPAADRQVN